MQDTRALRRDVVMVCRRLYERGLVAGQDGNVSVKVGDDRILVTPAGLSKVDVVEDDLVELSMDGALCDAGRTGRGASSEVAMHLRIYARRPDVRAVVHAHPPTATAFTVAAVPLSSDVLPESIFCVGDVATVPYAMPGTAALADAFEPYLSGHDAFLMAHHGATTVGATLAVAHQRMESLEHSARIQMAARTLGRVNTLSREDVLALAEARRRMHPRVSPPATREESIEMVRGQSSTKDGEQFA